MLQWLLEWEIQSHVEYQMQKKVEWYLWCQTSSGGQVVLVSQVYRTGLNSARQSPITIYVNQFSMEQHLWDHLYMEMPKNIIQMTHFIMLWTCWMHLDITRLCLKEKKEQCEAIICSVKVRRRDNGSNWPPWHLTTVSWKESELQTVWTQIIACDIRGEGVVSHYHCDPFNGVGSLFKEQERP